MTCDKRRRWLQSGGCAPRAHDTNLSTRERNESGQAVFCLRSRTNAKTSAAAL